MNNIGVAGKIFSACKYLADAASLAGVDPTAEAIFPEEVIYHARKAIVTTLTGATGTTGTTALIVDALDQSNVKPEFANVVEATDEPTLIQAWQRNYQTPLSTMYNQTYKYLTELATLKFTEEGNFVKKDKKWISFADWCGSEDGALNTLPSYVRTADSSQPSLLDMFSGTGDSALDIWIEIAQAAQTSTLPALAKYRSKTAYELVARLMSEIYILLGMIYYVHEASLSLLNALGEGSSVDFKTIYSDIQNFGNIADQGTVWGKFAQELTSLATMPDQIWNASMTCDQYPGGDSSMITKSYSAVQYCTSAPNSFFTALQMQQVGDQEVRLQGTLATIGPDLQLVANNTAPSAVNSGASPIPQASNNINLLYPTSPAPTSNNVFSVVTGFAFCQAGRGMGIALQFGEMDISDPGNPTVTVKDHTFVQPGQPADNAGYIGMPFTADLRPAGFYEPDRLGIMTNASLIKTHPAYGGRVGLNVQMAAPIYKADFFQPSNFPLINTNISDLAAGITGIKS